MSPQRRPISRRAAPSSARDGGDLARGEEDAVARLRRRRARPGRRARRRRGSWRPGRRARRPRRTSTYARPLAPRCLAQSCHASSCLRGCDAPPGMTTAPTYGAWNTRNGRLGEVVGALDELDAEAQVGLVGAVARHRLGVGHARDRARRSRTPISAPQRRHDGLADRDDVVLVDEAHLDVELGELGLPVGAEVLVAVAAGDLEVALHAGDHEQLLEQLRALRQGVPGARLQARRHEEVAGALGRRAGQRRASRSRRSPASSSTSRATRLTAAAQPERRAGRGAAQVEVAVAQARLLADLDVLVDRERQRRRRR